MNEVINMSDPSVIAHCVGDSVGVYDVKFQRDLMKTIINTSKTTGEDIDYIGQQMIAQWDYYCKIVRENKLKWTCMPRKFFEAGFWANESMWPWKDDQRPKEKAAEPKNKFLEDLKKWKEEAR